MAIFASDGALGATFKVTRALQAASMIAIIGMTSNFVSQLVSANATPPSILIGTLSIVCIAVLFCVITFILYLDNLLPFLINAIVDACFLVALIVVSIVVGKPLSYLNCNVIGKLNSDVSSAYSFTSALGNSIMQGQQQGSKFLVDYQDWIGTGKATCLEMKSIWGLCVALCILFFVSAVISVCLWKRNKSLAALPEKGEA